MTEQKGKKMEITNLKVERFLNHPGRIKFMDRGNENGVPIKLRYRVTKMKSKLDSEAKTYFEMKEGIIKACSIKKNDVIETNPNGSPKIDPRLVPKLNEDLKKLGQETMVLPDGYQYIEIDFEKDKWCECLTGSEMDALMLLMEE